MAKDERILGVMSRWAPRLVANGIPPTDYQEMLDQLENWGDWCKVFSARAAEHEAAGKEALAAGNTITAAVHLNTAAVIYHFGKFVFVEDMDQLKAGHMKAVECHTLAQPHMDPPGERVEIPYENGHLYGVLRKPRGVDNPPVVVMCMGMDSAKEEMATNEAHFHARGLATLAFDGPGQGEGEYDFAICPEYEKPAGAVVDYIKTRDDLNTNAIGIWGVSFGGYYAPRAAAFDKRIKACISISGPFDFGPVMQGRGSHEVFRIRAKVATSEELLDVAARCSMAEVAGNITCPIYIVGGTEDPLTPEAEQRQLAEEVSGPCELQIVQGGNHCVNNYRYKYSPRTADWIAGHLGGHVS